MSQPSGSHATTCRCDGSDRTISRLHDEKRELLQLLKSVHSWFMEKAPEHYNGCGLWIDVDITLRESANAEVSDRAGGGARS